MKPIGVQEEIYERLKKFRDDQGLTSFSNAIQVLLNFHSGAKNEVDALLKSRGIVRRSEVEQIVRSILKQEKQTEKKVVNKI